MINEDKLQSISKRINDASRITALTGAGISAASGIPTFRGDEGLWDEFDPSTLASPEGFRDDPERVWKWYNERRKMISDASPNPGHEALAELEESVEHFSLITQNVDGLHQEAGSQNIIRLHGNIWEVSCWEDCKESPEQWENYEVPFAEFPPSCPECGGLLRPNVVWFGEQLDPAILQSAQRAISCDVFLTIGTSAEVHPAAGFINRASQQGAYTLEINPESTSASSTVDEVLKYGAEDVLPELVRLVGESET